MPAYAYRIVNVFTLGHVPLSGNPLCVFERAQTLGYRPLEAEALYALAMARTDVGKTLEAEALLRRAENAGEAGGDDLLAAFGYHRLELVFVEPLQGAGARGQVFVDAGFG